MSLIVAFAAGLVGLLYVDRLRLVGGLLLTSAVLTFVAVLSYLSRDEPRFGKAALVMLFSTAASVAALVLSIAGAEAVEEAILSKATTPVVVVYVESDPGSRLATWLLARNINIALAPLNVVLLAYVAFRYARLQRLMAITQAAG